MPTTTFTVSGAKGVLGRLVDDALKSKPVFIRRGSRMVQLVPAAMPEPIPVRPPGYFALSADEVTFINSVPASPRPLSP